MELNGTNIGAQLVITFIALLLFGAIYNFGIEKFPWLAHRRSAEQVVGGVLVTLLASGFVIGWMNVVVMFILFTGSGLPMLIGSWVRAAHDDAEAKRQMIETLKK
jgi:hypothetical protein